MGLPDVVYLVRKGDANEELRYSLRSLANLPHRRVVIAGFIPAWVRNVVRVEVEQGQDKYANQTANLQAACTHPQVGARCVLFNDDFFIRNPIEQMPVLTRGEFRRVLAAYGSRNDRYAKQVKATAELLGRDALCYDSIHVPLPFDRDLMVKVLDSLPDGVLFRSVYGNRAGIGGRTHPDVKVRGRSKSGGGAFVSTEDSGFNRGDIGRQLRRQFPTPSRYEA